MGGLGMYITIVWADSIQQVFHWDFSVDEDESSWTTIRELVRGQPTILHPIAGPKDGRICSPITTEAK